MIRIPTAAAPVTLSTETIAQTNLRLFAQLREFRYDGADVAMVQRAYRFAMGLHAGAYRGSGKPLLAHTVGVASILVQLHAPVALVAAAVAHAVYVHGEWGDGYRGIKPWKRPLAIAELGVEVEALVAEYTQLEWGRQRAAQILAQMDSLTERGNHLLLMRLANELEDHLDLGVLHCSDAADRQSKIDDYLHLTIEMANRLGHPALADALTQVFNQCSTAQLPAYVGGKRTTFYVAPMSHCIRPGLRFRMWVRRVMQSRRQRRG